MGSLENRASWKFALDQTHYPSLPENSCPPIVKNLIYGHSWRRVQLFPTISTVLNGAIPSSVNLHNTTSLKLPINIILCLCSTSFRAIFPDIVENDCRIVPIFKFWVIRSHLLHYSWVTCIEIDVEIILKSNFQFFHFGSKKLSITCWWNALKVRALEVLKGGLKNCYYVYIISVIPGE